MSDELKKIGVLEVNHTHQTEALKRAFDTIEKVKESHEGRVAKDNEAHAKYDRTIAFAAGFVMAVSVFWTVFGIRMNNSIDDVARAMLDMKVHIAEDKIKTPDDVHRTIQRKEAP